MPYLEKLKQIKESKGMKSSQIAEISGVPLATVSRIFSGQTQSAQFDTVARIAIAMGASLDEIAGLKSADAPTPIVEQAMSNYAELLKEKDIRIEEYRKEAERAWSGAERAWRMVRHLIIAVVGLALAFLAVLLFDIANGHFGYFRY